MSRSRLSPPASRGADAAHGGVHQRHRVAGAPQRGDAERRPASHDDEHARLPRSHRALDAALGGGTALEPLLRADMEARFGVDFGSVRIRDDSGAHAAADAIDAKAYTVGEEIAFAADRFAPGTADGRRLLAHELAHVVQQRRGGAAPDPLPGAPHEVAADRAAAQVAAGAPGVAVAGATGVGVARDANDRHRARRKAAPQQASAQTEPSLPLEDDMRMFAPGPRYWLDHAPNMAAMKPDRLYDEAAQIQQWHGRQLASSREMNRLDQVHAQLLAEAARREQLGARPARRRGAHGGAKPGAAPAAGASLPRMLRERSSALVQPGGAGAEYNDLLEALQGDQLSRADRKLAQTELALLRPALAADLEQRAAQRQGEAIGEALTPKSAGSSGEFLVKAAERIDDIRPVPGQPGMSYVMHGHERLLMSDEQAASIRESMVAQMDQENRRAHSVTESVQTEWHDFIDLNYEEHPYVGATTMVFARSNPLNWGDELMPQVQDSNIAIGHFNELRKSMQDPWRQSAAALRPMAEATALAAQRSDAARDTYDRKVDHMMSTAGHIVTGLEGAKMAGQFAAAIAFTPAGAALYGGGESFLVQNREIAYGQRDGYDPLGIGFDAAAGYLGAKVTGGMLKLAKPAGLLGKAGLFVVSDRAGATVTRVSRMGMDQAAGRQHYALGDYGSAAYDEATDVKAIARDALLSWVGHRVQASRNPPRQPASSAAAVPEAGPTQAVSKPAVVSEPAAGVSATPAPKVAPSEAMPAQVPRVAQAAMPPARAANENALVGEGTPATGAGKVVPFDPNAQVPRSAASQRLDAMQGNRPRPAAGKMVPFRQRAAGGSEPATPAEAGRMEQPVAVGQTHGPDGGAAVVAADGPAPAATGAAETTAGPRRTGGSAASKPVAGSVKAERAAAAPARRAASGTKPAPKAGAEKPATAQPAEAAAANDQAVPDPIVAVRVGGGGAKKGSYFLEGTPEFEKAQGSRRFTLMSKSQADAMKFRPAGEAHDTSITPRKVGNRQAESWLAGRYTPHNISARVSVLNTPKARSEKTETANMERRNNAFDKTIGADKAQSHAYNALLTGGRNPDGSRRAGEYGLYRPGNISTGGVDAITAAVPARGPARVFLNDFTGMSTRKESKATHNAWRGELDAVMAREGVHFDNPRINRAVTTAIANGEVYIRAVRVDFSPSGGGELVIGPAVRYDPNAQ